MASRVGVFRGRELLKAYATGGDVPVFGLGVLGGEDEANPGPHGGLVLEPFVMHAVNVPLECAEERSGLVGGDLEHGDDARNSIALLLANLARGEALVVRARRRLELDASHGVAVAVVVDVTEAI